jgi:hypothetical protein
MVFHYCERLSPAFWAEPVNALTNAAFLIAAGLLSARLRRTRLPLREVFDIVMLIGLLCAIAIGSFLWHTLATPSTEWLDVVPILIYISLYLLSFLVRIARLKPLMVLAMFLLYHAVNIGLQLRFPPQTLNGSMFYLPTLATLLLMGIYSKRIRHPAANRLLLAGGVFVISIVLRTLDFALCPIWPIGTHFLWHLLNAYVLYILTLVLFWRNDKQ